MTRNLPHELVLLILEHFECLLPEDSEARRDECNRLALISRSWTDRARSLGWGNLLLHCDNQSLVHHVLAFPRLLEYVDTLCISTDRDGEVPCTSAKLPDRIVDCLRGCTRLRSLTLPVCTPELSMLEGNGELSCASTVEVLETAVASSRPFDFTCMVRNLARLPSLRTLRIRVALLDNCRVDASAVVPQLTIRVLDLVILPFLMANEGQLQRLGNNLLSCLDPTALSELKIRHYTPEHSYLRRISEFPNLASLRVQATTPSHIHDGLEDFLAAVSSFQHLRIMVLDFKGPVPEGESGDPVPAPVPLASVAAAMPPSLNFLDLEVIYFPLADADEFPPVPDPAAWVRGTPEIRVLVREPPSTVRDELGGWFHALRLIKVAPVGGGAPVWHRNEIDQLSDDELALYGGSRD